MSADSGRLASMVKARFRWAEKVLRLWDRSWGSPMSAKTAPKGHISLPSSTGMGMPLWAMRVKRPRVSGHRLASVAEMRNQCSG
jgi:hypothetical protein